MKKWNSKNVLRLILYTVLYVIGTVLVCVTGSFHPVLFVCYQITAGIILSGIVIKAFDQIKGFGVALCLSAGLILTFLVINDAVPWHVIPVIVIGITAELVRLIFKYNLTGNMIAAVIMTFSTFGYYAQIWFNREYTYECAVEEMPAGYADTLMKVSPAWAFPVVVIIGIVLSLIISNVTANIFHLDKE